MRPIIPKTNGKNQKLRDSARYCPHCMGCYLANPEQNLLCLAHANGLIAGKGIGMKSPDELGAILCKKCHDCYDGRDGNWTREKKHEFHAIAAKRTHDWWAKIGLLPLAIP